MPLTLDAENADTLADPAPTLSADMADKDKSPPQPKLRSIDDLRRLNRRATQEGMYAGLAGGAVMTWLAKRAGLNKNGLVVTFLLGSTGISFLLTRTIINRELGEHYAQRRAAAIPKAEDGSPLMLDPYAPPPVRDDPRSRLARELEDVGKPKPRTRFTKGVGLAGEVEEEEEMRDKYLRPGVPRV